MRWDPAVYGRWADERARPFTDLLARVDVTDPDLVVDLGCGPGRLTASLAGRWPSARVVGVDSSAEMIAAARSLDTGDVVARVRFVQADLREWTPDAPVDVLVSNAVLQWVPDHLDLLPAFASWLAPGGVLAVQVPGNFGSPAHLLLRELAASPPWRDRLPQAPRTATPGPVDYLARLAALGLRVDAWETTYLHVLDGPDPVLDWMRGTGLRPTLAALDDAAQAAFSAEYGERLRAAYPEQPFGTVLPFRRVFAVAGRPR
jgi:trans-aconitate 2-methyltransferase